MKQHRALPITREEALRRLLRGWLGNGEAAVAEEIEEAAKAAVAAGKVRCRSYMGREV